MATALDHASNGRGILGLGAGWHEPEHLGRSATKSFRSATVSANWTKLPVSLAGSSTGKTVTLDGTWVMADELINLP